MFSATQLHVWLWYGFSMLSDTFWVDLGVMLKRLPFINTLNNSVVGRAARGLELPSVSTTSLMKKCTKIQRYSSFYMGLFFMVNLYTDILFVIIRLIFWHIPLCYGGNRLGLWVYNQFCVSKKVYHPTTKDNFNSSCLIPVIFSTNITEWICHQKMVNFPPHLFSVHNVPWNTLRSWKSQTRR